MSFKLNERGWLAAGALADVADLYRVEVHEVGGARILDCGVNTKGSLEAGIRMAQVCLAGLAHVTLLPGKMDGPPCPVVQVQTDSPVLACMASQYAGWQISVGKYFAMGSGPMRAAYGNEELFADIPGRETPDVAVGVLETKKLPTPEVVDYLCQKLDVKADRLILLVAPASSLAGSIQVVARSVETALHKLHELEFDLRQVVSALGSAPLPPVATDELDAIGRTNDAILYAGEVMLWVDAADAEVMRLGSQVPSSTSKDHGSPFAEVLKRYDGDFYKIDPLLFSPAVVSFHNLRSGKSVAFGRFEPNVIRSSFFPTD